VFITDLITNVYQISCQSCDFSDDVVFQLIEIMACAIKQIFNDHSKGFERKPRHKNFSKGKKELVS
jgi:hypothetical protein